MMNYEVTRKEVSTGKVFTTVCNQDQVNNITKYPMSLYIIESITPIDETIKPVKIDTIVSTEEVNTNNKTSKATNRTITNKTKVVNSIYADKKESFYKEVMEIKRKLSKKTKDDIEGISYWYEKIISLYWLSCKRIENSMIKWTLKDAVKHIIESSVQINSYEFPQVKEWYSLGIL